MKESRDVSRDRSTSRQDCEGDGRVLRKLFEVDEGGDTDESEDEGNEDLVARPRVGDSSPGQTENRRSGGSDEDNVAARERHREVSLS